MPEDEREIRIHFKADYIEDKHHGFLIKCIMKVKVFFYKRKIKKFIEKNQERLENLARKDDKIEIAKLFETLEIPEVMTFQSNLSDDIITLLDSRNMEEMRNDV